MKTNEIYGKLPIDLGLVDLNPVEHMNWLYCPIKAKGAFECIIPDNLLQFNSLIKKVKSDIDEHKWIDNYVYLTVKTLWVNSGNTGNRAGWHSDGFMSNDLNYIWYDSNPTIFWKSDKLVAFTADHNISLDEMDEIADETNNVKSAYVTYPNKHLLKLDESVIHKVDTNIKPGMRTFIKVSVSDKLYDLKGNSINHKLNLNIEYRDRLEIRNDP